MLLEILREENSYELNLNDSTTRKFVLREIEATEEQFGNFIDMCVDLRLFEYAQGILWSRGLKTRMVQYDAKCAKLSENAKKRWNKEKPSMQLHSKSIAKGIPPTHVVSGDKVKPAVLRTNGEGF